MDLKDIKITKLKDNFTDQFGLKDPSCINKFAWSTIHMSIGETMSCHRVDGDKLSADNFSNFHNTPSKIKDRERMINGLWPDTNGPNPIGPHKGCEVCREVEAAGGISDRISDNEDKHLLKKVPKEIKADNKATTVTPTILEVFYNNQCNLACIYCAPKFSSLIAAESYRHGTRTEELTKVLEFRKDYKQLVDAHFAWMKDNAKFLYRYNILGGEPFYQPELEQNIDFFMDNKCPNLKISIFSNLNIDKDKFRSKLNRLSYLVKNKHVNVITLHCSFDCWGPQIEYIRHGLNLQKWEENFLILLNEFPDIEVIIHSTLTAITFSTFPELVDRIKNWSSIRTIRHTISTVDSRPFLYPGILPEENYKSQIQESIKIYLETINVIKNTNYKYEYDNQEKIHAIAHIHRVIAQLKSYEKTFDKHSKDKFQIGKLIDFLNINDSRRNTNWKLLWPWLDMKI